MHKIWVVVRREFVARVRTKWFVFSTVAVPVLMATMVFLPILMSGSGGGSRSIVVVDATGVGFGERLTRLLTRPVPLRGSSIEVRTEDIELVADSLTRAVGDQDLDGFLLVTEETIEDGVGEYRGSNAASQLDMDVLQRFLREAVLAERLRRVGVDPAVVARAQRSGGTLRTVTIRGGEATEQSGGATFAVAYVMWFLLYMAILLYGVQVLSAVVEDKTTRIVEVLVSSLRPFELLAGKVIGVGAVGLFQLLIWVLAGSVLLTQRVALMGVAGFEAGTASGFSLPEIPVSTIVVFLVYFVLGFLLYAAVFAAVASMSSSEADARQLQAPVSMLYVIPSMMSLMAMINEPDGGLFVTLTMIPFSSPVAMPGRWVVSDVSLVELFLSMALLALSVVIVTWIAGRIFRVGILAQGKRPNVKTLWRWVRAS